MFKNIYLNMLQTSLQKQTINPKYSRKHRRIISCHVFLVLYLYIVAFVDFFFYTRFISSAVNYCIFLIYWNIICFNKLIIDMYIDNIYVYMYI